MQLPVIAPLFFLLLQSDEPALCPPCATEERAAEIRAKLTEAFELAIATASCDETASLEACRGVEERISESFSLLREIVTDREAAGAIDCLACDPRPLLAPIYGGLESLATLLSSKDYVEFDGRWRAMVQELELWKAYRCCGSEEGRARPSRNREMDARGVLAEKCGESFERSRQGLRQMVRMPGDKPGCYQSRACRTATQYNGAFMEAGFWTYDGEYWYVWADRRTPRGEWITCNP